MCEFCGNTDAKTRKGSGKSVLCNRCYNAFHRFYTYKRKTGEICEPLLSDIYTVTLARHGKSLPNCIPKYIRTELISRHPELEEPVVTRDGSRFIDKYFSDIL